MTEETSIINWNFVLPKNCNPVGLQLKQLHLSCRCVLEIMTQRIDDSSRFNLPNQKYKRPQHVIAHSWRKFDHPLIKKKDLNITSNKNEYGLNLKAKDKIKSPDLQKIYDTWHN